MITRANLKIICYHVFFDFRVTALTDSLLKWIRPEIRQLAAYHVPDSDGMIKLDAMENPYVLPQGLIEQWQEILAGAALNRYPDPASSELTKTLASVMGVPDSQSIVLGNGSDELIQMLAMAVAQKDRCILSFDPGFVMYKMIAEFVGMQYVGVPLSEQFELDMDSIRIAIKENNPAIIFIAYPNNPTANCFSESDIEEIIRLAPGLVVVDEAYHPFAQKSFMPLLEQYDQLLVMRTVSKMGLAGLRLGLLCGHSKIIDEVNKIRLPYNINVLTQLTAKFVLENINVLDEQAELIRSERENLFKTMNELQGVDVFPSHANFILFRVNNNNNASDVFEGLKSQGVLIKNMKASEGLLSQCLRVTVGTPAENQLFINALNKSLVE